MPDEDPFEEHLRAFYKKERELGGEEHAPSEDEWQLIQRKRRKEEETKYPPEEEVVSFWSFPKLAFAFGLVGTVILAAIIFLRPREIQLAGLRPEVSLRGDELSLPVNLRLSPKGAFITLTGPEGKLKGPLNLTNSSPGLFFFDVTLLGANSEGAVEFKGRLILTNSAPSSEGLTKENISGALLDGKISRPGLTTNITARRYILR